MNCGECTECCELLFIDSSKSLQENEIELINIQSAAGELCVHCDKNVGCTVHEQRPKICRTYECAYSQQKDIPLELRPDKCGVIFEKLDEGLFVGTVRPNRTISEYAAKQIDSFNNQNISVVLTKYDTTDIKVFSHAGETQRETMMNFAKYRRAANG